MRPRIPKVLQHVFGGRQTRRGSFYSPFVVDTTVEFDSLLRSAAKRQEDFLDSPLSTPPSSRAASPEPMAPPAQQQDLIDQVTQRLVDEEGESNENGVEGVCQGKKRRRRRKKSNVQQEKLNAQQAGQESLEVPESKKRKAEDQVAESKSHSHRNRCNKRRRRTEDLLLCPDEDTLKAIARAHGKRSYPKSQKAETDVAAEAFRKGAASTGYIGNAKAELPERREYSLDELVGEKGLGFRLVKAKNVTQYVPCPKNHRIHIVIDPGPRNDPSWKEDCREGAEYLRECREECRFPNGDEQRRGRGFSAVGFGVSSGNGQPRPMMRNDQGVRRKRVMEKIREHRVFVRIAGFMSTTFLTWAPLLFWFYAVNTSALLECYRDLTLPFYNSIFASFTVNFGPRTVTFPHRDSKNLAFGWCAITALGNFDYERGGHLVLWDLDLVIEFPPGTTIFVPSAVVCHFNTSIQPHEERYSFTLYSAGDLFRWVEHGFRHEQDYKDTAEAEAASELNRTRWQRGMNLFSTMDELIASTI